MFREFNRAKRNGTLFRLDRQVSGFVYLALRLKARFESLELIRAGVSALKRLKEAGDAAYARYVSGIRMAWAFSEAAVNWGHQDARGWRNDTEFARFLSMNLEFT